MPALTNLNNCWLGDQARRRWDSTKNIWRAVAATATSTAIPFCLRHYCRYRTWRAVPGQRYLHLFAALVTGAAGVSLLCIALLHTNLLRNNARRTTPDGLPGDIS